MANGLKLSASVAALSLLLIAGAAPTQAADIVAEEPGCTLSGQIMAGYMYNWQDVSFDFDSGDDKDGDVDWETPFGEGAGLVTCGGFNIQADVAYYAHSGDVDDDDDWDQTNSHIGGVLFFRDPSFWAGGLGASWISQDVDGRDIDVWRVGLFGELYLNDVFTLGVSGHYYDADWPNGKEDGLELTAWARFYATPDFSLLVRGDVLLADYDLDFGLFFGSDDLEGFAISGEAEYLVWDQGLSIFGGARYAERSGEFTFDLQFLDDADVDVDDFQVFAGIKFYFGQDGTLIERQRTGTVDNTSVFNEKLPNFFTSTAAGFEDAGGFP